MPGGFFETDRLTPAAPQPSTPITSGAQLGEVVDAMTRLQHDERSQAERDREAIAGRQREADRVGAEQAKLDGLRYPLAILRNIGPIANEAGEGARLAAIKALQAVVPSP